MADRTNSSARGGFDALSPISQGGNTSLISMFGANSPGAKLEDPFYVRERGIELIGRRVLKQFGAAKEKFCGTIVSVDEEQEARTYLVRYEDGDEEDVVEDELLKCLLKCNQPSPLQRNNSSASARETSGGSERVYGAANSSGRSANQPYFTSTQGSRVKTKHSKQLKPRPKVQRAKRETKSMQVKREAATRRFINNRKHYFSQLDEFELECE